MASGSSNPPKKPAWLDSLPELPLAYDENRLHGMAIDPFGALAFWDFSELIEKALLEKVPAPQRKVLRIFDVTTQEEVEGAMSWDIPLESDLKHLLFEIGQPGREFIFSLGYVGADNRYYELGQSDRVRLPHHTPSKKRSKRSGHWDSEAGNFVEESPLQEEPALNPTANHPFLEAFMGGEANRHISKRTRESRINGPARHWLHFQGSKPSETGS